MQSLCITQHIPYPSLINCVYCLLNGEQRLGNNPTDWQDDDLKNFIHQAHVRLVNCPLIPHRFQWLSGGNSLPGNPIEITDLKKP